MGKSRIQRTRISAYGLLVDERGMLLCRISEQAPPWSGYWTLPGGGIDFGESPADAMVREVYEETGLHVEPATVVAVNSLLIHGDDESFQAIRIIYEAKLLGGELRYEEDGSTDMCQWCSAEEIQEIDLVELAVLGVELVQNGESAA